MTLLTSVSMTVLRGIVDNHCVLDAVDYGQRDDQETVAKKEREISGRKQQATGNGFHLRDAFFPERRPGAWTTALVLANS